MSKNGDSWFEWLGLNYYPNFKTSKLFGSFIGFLLVAVSLFLVLAALIFAVRFSIMAFTLDLAAATAEDVRNLGLVVAAIIGVPFLIWRSVVAQKQVDVAEQGQITDRINKAVEGLGAEKNAKRQRKNSKGELLYEEKEDNSGLDFKRPIMEEVTEPNLEVRIGAIYALERISQDSLRDHIQIMEILCAYVRQNFPANMAVEPTWTAVTPLRSSYFFSLTQQFYNPDWFSDQEVRNNVLGSHLASLSGALGNYHESNAVKWAKSLEPRSDLQAIITVLGRRAHVDTESDYKFVSDFNSVGFQLNLTSSNLQGIVAEGLDLRNAIMDGCSLDGSLFNRAQLSGISARNASFIGADFSGCIIQDAVFYQSNMSFVWANDAHFSDCLNSDANFCNANLAGVVFERTSLNNASLEGCNLYRATFVGNEKDEGKSFRTLLYGQTNLFGAKVMETVFFDVDLNDFACFTPNEESSAFCDTGTKNWSEEINGFTVIEGSYDNWRNLKSLVERTKYNPLPQIE